MKNTKIPMRISIISGAIAVFFGAISMYLMEEVDTRLWIPLSIISGFFLFLFFLCSLITYSREAYNTGFKYGEKSGEQKAFNKYINQKRK